MPFTKLSKIHKKNDIPGCCFLKYCPGFLSFRDLEWRVCNDAGIESNLAGLEAHGQSATVTALGDGRFRLRCMCKNGASVVRLISQLEFEATGLGTLYLNPYQFVSAGLYNAFEGELSNGNERGIAASRDGECRIGFQGLNLGETGSDEITIPLFVLDSDKFRLQIWEGKPHEPESKVLGDIMYQKPSIWNVYQEETYRLSRKRIFDHY